MSSTSSQLILARVGTFVYGGTLFAVTKRLNDFLPVSYLLCACWWQAEKPCTICCVVRWLVMVLEALKPPSRQPGKFKFLAKLKLRSTLSPNFVPVGMRIP